MIRYIPTALFVILAAACEVAAPAVASLATLAGAAALVVALERHLGARYP